MSPRNESSTQSGCMLKILIGCGLIVLLVVLMGFAGCLWMSTPGEQIDTAAIQGEASLGTMEVGDLLEDEGFGELVVTAIDEMNAQQQRNLPAWFPRQKSSVEDMGVIVPKSATVTFEEIGEAGRPRLVAALNFRGWVRPLKMLFGFLNANNEDIRDYRGHRIISAEDRFLMAFHESTLLLSDHPDALEQVIDRLVDGTGTGLTPLPEGAVPAGAWDATGGMRNDDGSLDRLLAPLFTEAPPAAALGADASLGFGLDIASTDRATLAVQLGGSGEPAVLEAHAEALAAHVAGWLDEHNLPTTATVVSEGSGVVASFEILGLLDAVLAGWDLLDDFPPHVDTVAPATPETDPPATGTTPRDGSPTDSAG